MTTLPVRLACLLGAFLALTLPARLSAQPAAYYGVFTEGSLTINLQPILNFETMTGKPVSIVNYFTAWGATSGSQYFSTATVNNIRNHGSIPMITWEPWDWVGPTNPKYRLQEIADGKFDAYITQWALAAKAWGHPFFLRMMHEMNGHWYPWSENVNGNIAWTYITAWRHVHDIFVDNGVNNVTWVWCVAHQSSSIAPPLANYYPGDNYVDWVAIDGYNRGNIPGNDWQQLSKLMAGMYQQFKTIAPAKPIMIAETGSVEQGGSKAGWYNDALTYDLKWTMPRIKAFVYFNKEAFGYDNRVNTSASALSAFSTGVKLSHYAGNTFANLAGSPIQPLLHDVTSTDTMPPFATFSLPRKRDVVPGSTIELRVDAIDKSGIVKVEFFVNGALRQTENIAPWQYWWPVPSGANQTYLITAKVYDAYGNTALCKMELRAR